MQKDIAIIGAGLSGLVAAHALKKAGHLVTVYEAASRPGGVIESVREQGYLFEKAAHTLLEISPTIRALIDELGLRARCVETAKDATKRFVVRGGVMRAVPTSVLGMVTTRILSLGAKCALLREPFISKRTSSNEENLSSFVRRRLGDEFVEYMIKPLIGGIYAGDVERLSVRYAFPTLFEMEQRCGSLLKGQIVFGRERKARGDISRAQALKLSFDGGLATLTDRLGEVLGDSLKLHHQIHGLELQNGRGPGYKVLGGVRGDRFALNHDTVVLALPAHQLKSFSVAGKVREQLLELATLPYAPIVGVALGYRRDAVRHPLDGFGVLVPPIEGFTIRGTIFASSLFPGRAPQGSVLLSSFLGGAIAPEILGWSDEQILGATKSDLARLVGARGEPEFVAITRWAQAIPQYEIGYGSYLECMERIERELPGVYLLGNYRGGIALTDCIHSGVALAECLANDSPR